MKKVYTHLRLSPDFWKGTAFEGNDDGATYFAKRIILRSFHKNHKVVIHLEKLDVTTEWFKNVARILHRLKFSMDTISNRVVIDPGDHNRVECLAFWVELAKLEEKCPL